MPRIYIINSVTRLWRIHLSPGLGPRLPLDATSAEVTRMEATRAVFYKRVPCGVLSIRVPYYIGDLKRDPIFRELITHKRTRGGVS